MFYHVDLYGNDFETCHKVAKDMTGEFAVVNCPSEEMRSQICRQYFDEVRSEKRTVGETIFSPGFTPESTLLSEAEQWL
jgi:hypothetical protein